MDMFPVVVLLLIPALFIHAFNAIRLTGAQRLAVLNAIRDPDPRVALAKLAAFDQADFDSHLWRLLTFRSPWTIYPELLRDEVEKAGA